MHALVLRSLIDVPEILLTVVSTFSVGFLLWFLVGLLREERRMRARRVHGFRFRVLKLEHREPKGAHTAPAVRTIQLTGEAGKVHALDQRSPKGRAVKMRWLIMGLLLTATVRMFQNPSPPSPLLARAEPLASPVPPIVAGPIWQAESGRDGVTNVRL